MLTHARMQDVAARAPDFRLPDTVSGRLVSPDDFTDRPALLVAFICNHCPFVLHIVDGFARFASEYGSRGLAVVAVCANDAERYPDDAPDKMKALAGMRGFEFPYLHDDSQAVALAYGAVCTPDFFLFDWARRLAYRGQFDAARPKTEHWAGNGEPVTGADLRRACDAVLAGRPAPGEQVPSRGCVVKWKPGNAPDWR